MSDSLRLRTSFLAFIFFLLCCPLLSHADVGFRRSLRDSTDTNFLTQRPAHGISRFRTRAIFDYAQPLAKSVTVIDTTTYSSVTLGYRASDQNLLPPTPLTYEQYRDLRWTSDVDSVWREAVIRTYKHESQQKTGEGIAIDVPFRIKSKTFRRLFGGDNVGVRVQGNITINGNVRRQKTDQMQAANQQNTNTSFRIDMVQQFSITGKVGEKVEVRVDQDSERLFDFENSIRLAYTGDEDEIVQSIEAGNVNLNLGTRLATFSGKNTGLFGLKTQMKLGPLNLTGIASLERGQKNRQRPNQQAQGESFDERDFLRGVYFWLADIDFTHDTTNQIIPVPNYRDNYRHLVGRIHQSVPDDQKVQEIEVYVSQLGAPAPGSTSYDGRAVAMQFLNNLDAPNFADLANADNRNYKQSSWQKLTISTQYTFDQNLGVLRLTQPLADQQALAVAFSTQSGQVYGKLRQPDNQLRLILLKAPDPASTDSTWNLMFRNVYYVGGTNIIPDNFRLTLSRAAGSTNGQEETSPPAANVCPDEYAITGGCTYLTFFRLDVEGQGGALTPDGVVDAGVFNPQLGELQFFDLTPFDPSGYIQVNNGRTDSVVWKLRELENLDTSGFQFMAPFLYTEKPTQFTQHGALWKFITEFKGTASVFQLGPLVLEGSEEVTLNGQPLHRGIDYTVDYSSGELRILNEAAKAQGANLEITYESGQVFQLDKKTLLGARAEYELWDQSYIGGMVLHLNEKTLDKRVRIGNEPVRNTLYDANTSLRFTPGFLTRVVDALPLVKTDQGSELVLDGEVARVYPNPNSLENPGTGDYNGLAYIDDFEQSRRATPLGLLRRMWTISSVPDTTHVDRRRGRFRWWNPRPNRQVPVQEVFPEREVNSQVANTLPTLIMSFAPQPGDSANPAPERSWGGVMRYLGEGYADQSQAQYLELWVDLTRAAGAELVVDLGEISEDALPNGRMDSEDRPVGITNPNPQQEYGNGLLDRSPDEDSGLDGVFGTDPSDSAYWNGEDRPPVPSLDDWSYDPDESNPQQVNGTEHSRNDEAGNYPDTEDLNNDNFLNTSNNYFSYSITLNEDNPYIAGGNPDNKWRLFRIPIQTADSALLHVVGAPDITNIRWARIYMTGANREATVRIVQMDIVSNEWLPQGGLSPDSTEWMTAAVINTHENPGYASPPGVSGEVDPITNLRQREQSLVLKVNRLGGGAPDEFFLVKNLHQANGLNLLEYKQLKMFVHGGGEDAAQFEDGKYDLILRFAANDVQNNYYDIVVPVKRGWDPANVIDVTLNDISIMKARRDSTLAVDSTLSPSARFAYDRIETPWEGDSLVIKGNPSLSRVFFIGLGVRLASRKWFDGQGDQIWVDELRVTDIYRDPGTAGEMNATLRLADFISLQGGYSTRDADFHNVNVRTSSQGGSPASSSTMRGNATVALQKIGLDRYGFQLPLTASYSDNLGVPKYIPNTDSRVDMSHVPEEIKSVQQTYGYTFHYSKTGNAKSPWVRYSLEKLNLGWEYNYNKAHDFNTLLSRSETSSATAGYNFPTAKGRGLAPFSWTKRIPGLRLLGSPKFYYKPTRLQFTARADRRDEYRETRGLGIVPGVVTAPAPVINTAGGVNIGFNFIEPLTTDFTRSYRGIKQNGQWSHILQGDYGRINDIQQNFNNAYSPQIASWLRPTLNYTAGYTWSNPNLVQSGQQSVSNQRNVGADVQFDFRSIFGGGSGAARGRDRVRGNREGNQPPRPPVAGGPPGAPGMENPMSPPGPFEDPLHERMQVPQPGDSSAPRGHQPLRNRPGGSIAQTPDTLRAPGDTTAVVPDTTRRAGGFTLGRQFGRMLRPLKKALLVLDPIVLSYDNTQSHSQRATLGQASWQYQLGFTQQPDTRLDTLGTASFAKRQDQNVTGRSGIRFTQDIRSTFNYARRWGESLQGANPSGSIEETQFWIVGKKKPTRFPFVDVTMDWGGLEKIAFLGKVAQTVSLTSSISQRVTETWQNQQGNITQREHVRQWNPLLGINLTWKGNIDSQVRYGVTSHFTDNPSGHTQRRSSEDRVAATVSYSIKTGFRIPVLWLKSLRLQNQTTFSLNVDYSSTRQETKRSDSDVFTIQPGSEVAWSLSPRMTYSFSNTVQGQGYVQLQQRKDAVTSSKSRVFEFGIQVQIAIRG